MFELNRCPKCYSLNKVNVTNKYENIIFEAATICSKCCHVDYWVTGNYETNENRGLSYLKENHTWPE